MASSLIFLCPKKPQSKQKGGSGSEANVQLGKQSIQRSKDFVFMRKDLRVVDFQLHQLSIAKNWNTWNGV